jgi:putative glycosyltransferase (TIGR04372 family)
LTFKEAFDSPISNFRFTSLYQEAGIRVEENTPEDIQDLVREMIERLEGRAEYTREDEELQQTYKSLLQPGHYSYGVPSRIGRGFLRKYRDLVMP